MKSLLTVEELESRRPSGTLPLYQDGEGLDTARIQKALDDATGIIVAHLPWLIDAETSDIVSVVPPQFAGAVLAACSDIACHRLLDTVASAEDEREWFKNTMALIEKISAEHQGGLEGPGFQESAIVYPDEKEGIRDGRFFKKGRLF
uniref:DUF1320 domain-containing protein n=1 Tax=uncultured Spirochaetaceae bacterium TaxID=201186 RepID=A0A650EPF9_9SPIO|nr:hypothetical protein Unknown280_0140 [uncultured Spirochaetaceae bacterium]